MHRPIQDYAVIGDCRSAALVSRDGSLDWLCWPRFDSPALFAALLDAQAGSFSVAPTPPFRSTRRYVFGTNVLETEFRTPTGTLRLTDLMPVCSEEHKREGLFPDHHLLRELRCLEGEVEVEMRLRLRPEYGRRKVRWREAGGLGFRAQRGGALLTFRTTAPPSRVTQEQGALGWRGHLRAGEAHYLSLTLDDEWAAVLPPLGAHARMLIERSIAWWRSWASQLTYEGPCREAVLRSVLLLKLLVYAPSGAVLAAPTTSLPERVGGDLNWDYRFCWLRDAALTVRALFALGFHPEAEAFLSWLLHSTRLTQPQLRVLYDVYGNPPAAERTLAHLAGYGQSRPVRVGNAAATQLQLDVYGEVIDAAAHFVCRGGAVGRDMQRMLRGFGDYVCQNWNTPDEGIWEPRSGKAHHTHSRVLCWTALQRLIELARGGHLGKVPVESFTRQRDLIRQDIETRGWSARRGSYVAVLDGEEVDASLLLLPWYGFEPASSERMRQTYARIREELGAPRGLLYRYRNFDSPGEGAFGICSFWGAEFLALGGGSVEEAAQALEALVGLGNDVGLFAEELDPATGDALGNFPQAFTHVGLINAAVSLSQRLAGQRALERQVPLARGVPARGARR